MRWQLCIKMMLQEKFALIPNAGGNLLVSLLQRDCLAYLLVTDISRDAEFVGMHKSERNELPTLKSTEKQQGNT